MKVAFCTQDSIEINEHFGRAKQIIVYNVNKDGFNLDGIRNYEPIDGSKEHKIDTEDKISTLKDCSILYLADIGGPAAAAVIRSKIHPVKVTKPVKIEEILNDLTSKLNDNPPPWIRKILMMENNHNH